MNPLVTQALDKHGVYTPLATLQELEIIYSQRNVIDEIVHFNAIVVL